MPLSDLASDWRSAAVLFREHEQPATAVAYEKCAEALERALSLEGEVILNLQEAAEESGYSPDHLGRLVREGRIPNAGRPGAPRIARRDIPRNKRIAHRPRRAHIDRAQIVRSAIRSGDP